MPLTPLSDTSGFTPLSNAGFTPLSDPASSLLESKKSAVAAISSTKKQALDPSSMTIPYEDVTVIDADTFYNNKSGEKFRMTPNIPGVSYNPWEVPHPGKPLDQARLLDQEKALAKEHDIPTSYFPNQAIFGKGIKAKAVFGDLIKGAGSITINKTGEIDKWGRTLADITAAGSDQSLLAQMNTPELNADYHSKYNIVKEGEDLLRQAVRREEETKYSVSDSFRETPVGGAINMGAAGLTTAADLLANFIKSPFELAEQNREQGITNKQRDLSNALNTKIAAAGEAGAVYTPTAEEQAVLETPQQAFVQNLARPFLEKGINVTAKDLLLSLANSSPLQLNTNQKLATSEFIQKNITDNVTKVQENLGRIYNSTGSDQVHKDAKALYNDSIEPTFVEGVEKFKNGDELAGSLQVADAIANAGAGIFRVGANNPQAVAEEVVKQIPNAYAATKHGIKMFLGLYTDNASRAQDEFVKEHSRFPEGAEVDRLQIDSAASAALDTVADKMLVSKPGVARSFVREGTTEGVQSVLEQDAGKQDLSKIDFSEAYANDVIGALSGAGNTAAANPVAAIKEAGSAVATVGSTAFNLASKLVPTSVSEAAISGTQAVSNAVGSATQAVTDAVGEVASSTTTPRVDPVQQASQEADSVKALTTLLQPENSPKDTTTPEARAAFLTVATDHNLKIGKTAEAMIKLDTSDMSHEETVTHQVKAKELLTTFRANKETIDGIKAFNAAPDTTDADIAILGSTEPADQASIPLAVDRTIRSMRQPNKISLEQAESFQSKATLTPEQASVVTAFIATQKSMKDVGGDVRYGSAGFLGMAEHQAILSDALDQGNIPAAKSSLASFSAFTNSQVKKASSLKAIVSAISSSNVEQVKGLVTKFAKDFPSHQTLKLGNTEILKLLEKPKGLEVAKGSDAFGKFQGLTNTVGNEANMLTTALSEAQLHFTLASKTTTAETPITAQEEQILEEEKTTASTTTTTEPSGLPGVGTIGSGQLPGAAGLPSTDVAGLSAGNQRTERQDLLNPEGSLQQTLNNETTNNIRTTGNDATSLTPLGDGQSGAETAVGEAGGIEATFDTAVAVKEEPVETVPATSDSELPSSKRLLAESDKRIDAVYSDLAAHATEHDLIGKRLAENEANNEESEALNKEHAAIVKEYERNELAYVDAEGALEQRLDKELSSRIAALQISAETKQDLQSRYAEVKTYTNELLEDSKPFITEVRAIEKEIAKNQSDVFESSNTTEDATTEIVDPLTEIIELARIKNFTEASNAPNFVAAVVKIYKTKSLNGVSPANAQRALNFLRRLSLKTTKTLGTQLLERVKKFKASPITLKDLYTAKTLNKDDKNSVLLTIPNFFTQLKKDPTVVDSLGLSEEQRYGLEQLNVFNADFAEAFKEKSFNPNLFNKEAEVLDRNPALYFMKEGGSFANENLISTLATVGYSWVANTANSLIQHDDAGINALLGRDSKQDVTAEEYEILGDKQILRSALITSLGREAYSSLGLEFNPKADGAIESKMIEALGSYIVMTLDHMKVLTPAVPIHQAVFLALKAGKEIPDVAVNIKDQDRMYFTGVATELVRSANGKYSNPELSAKVQKIVDDNRNSKGLLTELFGYTQRRAMPSLEAPTLESIPKTVRGTGKKLTKRQRKALHKYGSNGFTVNLDNHTVLDFLERGQIALLLEANESLEGVHAENIKSQQGKNSAIKRGIESYFELVEFLKLQKDGLATPVYISSFVAKNGRTMMEGLISPQADKFIRHMLGMSAWESTIDTDEKMEQFKIAVAEALGSKVGNQSRETSLEAFRVLASQEEIVNGVAAVQAIKSGKVMTTEEKYNYQQDILDAVKAGKSKTHALEALTALAAYSDASVDGKPFTTRMTVEVDGVVNGVTILLMQLMGQTPEKMLEFLKASGISTDPDFNYGEFMSLLGSSDNYQRVARTLIEHTKAFRNQLGSKATKDFNALGGTSESLDGIEFFTGELTLVGALTAIARDLVKNPVMINSFGATIGKIKNSLGDRTIKNFYKALEENRDNQVALNTISTNLNNILGGVKRSITTEGALKFKLSKSEIIQFKGLVAASIGTSMGEAIKEHFEPLMAKRSEINNAAALVHAVFTIKYNAAVTAAKLAKGAAITAIELEDFEEGKTAAQIAEFIEKNKGREGNLSKEEANAIVKSLETSRFSFEHALSDGNINSEMLVSNTSNATVMKDGKPDEAFRVQVNSRAKLKHLNDKGDQVGSISANGSARVFDAPGVAPAIGAAHGIDGAVQFDVMEMLAVLNIFDANISGIDGMTEMALAQNGAFKDVIEGYSIREAFQKTLLRSIATLTPEEVAMVNDLLQITDKTVAGFLGHSFVAGKGAEAMPKYQSIDSFVTEFTDTTKRDAAAKKALVKSLKSWGQYNLDGGAHVTDGGFAEMRDLFLEFDAIEESPEKEKEYIEALVAEEIAAIESRRLKSSSTEDIDTATFAADPTLSDTISAEAVVEIFDALGKIDPVTDTPAHTEHLRTVLNTSIRQVLNPMEMLVRKLGKANSGVLEKGAIYLNIGSDARLHTTDQSAQEVYSHELVHAVTETGLASSYWLRKMANALYDKVQAHITPESFLDYDGQGNVIVPDGSTLSETIDKAKAVYDHIFDNNDFTTTSYRNPITNEIVPRQYNNGLLEFIAFGTTNAKFIKILAGINTNRSKRVPETFADAVFNLFVGALNSVMSLINKTKDPAASVALMILMHRLANANQVKSSFIMRKLQENANYEEFVNSKIYKMLEYSVLTSGQILKARKNKTLSAIGEVIALAPKTDFEAYQKVAGKLARRVGITHKSFLSKLATEAEGITAITAKYAHLLSKSNMLIDQRRRLEAHILTNQILKSFIAGTPSKSESIAITKVMLKTDMGNLIDKGYTWDKVFDLLKGKSKLATEISTVEKLLQAEAPTNFDFYRTQAHSLGHMRVTGDQLKEGTRLNAINIANLGDTGKTVEGNVDTIEGYIDTIVILRAMQYSNEGHVKDFVTIAEREFAKDKDNNGVMLSYLAHKDLKARALTESFEGQKELMIGGYTKEITNPRVSIITAPSSMEAVLKAKGYKIESRGMAKDPSDPNKIPMSTYVNRDGDTATFMKMIVSLTSEQHKGTSLTTGYSSIGELNPALLGSFDVASVTARHKELFASADYADMSKVSKGNLLVPVENVQHEIVGYRYMMSESTKDRVLEKDNSFAKILGAMEGSIVDKKNSKKINREAVNLMREDFKANYSKDPELFVKFSLNSQDKDDRELYRMLPNDMRREIKKVWGSNEMYVRAKMFETLFGFRKFTVSEGSKEMDEMGAMHRGVLGKLTDSLRDRLRTPTAKKIEIGLQEIAKEVKDAIVIKSGTALKANVISNNWLLWVKGVNRSAILADQVMFIDAARQYHKDETKLKELERSVRINPKLQNSANVKAKINTLKNDMAMNPIATMYDSGVANTIAEDIDIDDSQYTYKGMLQEKLSPFTSRVPAPLRKLASFAYMTHDTPHYKFLREATMLSDLVARATLHKHNVEKLGMTFEASIIDIKETFVDYDAPTSKQLQYLNDMNVLMFTKFFIRSQKVIAQTYINAPTRLLGLLGFEGVLGETPSIDDSNIFNTSVFGRISNPLGLVGELASPHTLSLPSAISGGGGSYPS